MIWPQKLQQLPFMLNTTLPSPPSILLPAWWSGVKEDLCGGRVKRETS